MKPIPRLLLAILVLGCADDAGSEAAHEGAAGSAAETSQAETTRQARPDTIDRQGGPEAAVRVLSEYYEAIASHDYARAYSLWASEGQASGQTFDAFRAGFEQTASVNARVGTAGRIEGAAGSRYVEIPVTIRARTTAGAEQCFRGTYTLRRSEVEGATPDQRSWRIYGASISQRPAAECTPNGAADAAADSARQAVKSFGQQLASVSLLAPPDVVRREVRARYGPLVTAALLARWLAQPAEAPGREVSSPWPDHIEIVHMEKIAADAYQVVGDIVLMTSTGQAARERVNAEVTRASAGWRVSDWD